MIKPNVIDKLNTFHGGLYQILSVYLSADTVQAPTGEYLLTQFHSLLHQNLNKELRKTFKSDIEHIEEYLSTFIHSAKTLIFFSAGKQLWEAIELAFYIPQSLVFGTSPYTYPLMQSLQKHTKYLVFLVDREKARMFTVEQDEIIEQSELINDIVPQKVKSMGREMIGGEGSINARYIEGLLAQHIELAVKAVSKFTDPNDINFVIIGGHKEMFKKVINSLPTKLQTKVAGTFVTEVNIPLNEILLKSKKIAASIR